MAANEKAFPMNIAEAVQLAFLLLPHNANAQLDEVVSPKYPISHNESRVKIIGHYRINFEEIDLESKDQAPLDVERAKYTKYGKFADAVASAYITHDDEVKRIFKADDGTVYYSSTIRGKTTCYMTGPVNSPSGASKGPASIACPPDSGNWKNY
jgi:hypothetical protein